MTKADISKDISMKIPSEVEAAYKSLKWDWDNSGNYWRSGSSDGHFDMETSDRLANQAGDSDKRFVTICQKHQLNPDEVKEHFATLEAAQQEAEEIALVPQIPELIEQYRVEQRGLRAKIQEIKDRHEERKSEIEGLRGEMMHEDRYGREDIKDRVQDIRHEDNSEKAKVKELVREGKSYDIKIAELREIYKRRGGNIQR